MSHSVLPAIVMVITAFSCMMTETWGCRFAAYVGEDPLQTWNRMFSNTGHGLRKQADVVGFSTVGQTRYTPRKLCDEGAFHSNGIDANLNFSNCMCYEQDDNRNFWLNTAGAGIGWYDANSQARTSTTGHNSWFLTARDYVPSAVVFAHVRANAQYRPWTGDSAKSHPFRYGRLMLMHNGGIPKVTYDLMKREVESSPACQSMKNDQGGNNAEVDSNIMGLWYAQKVAELEGKKDFILRGSDEAYSEEAMVKAMEALLEKLMAVRKGHDDLAESSLNFGVTDGHTSIFTRFRDMTTPPSTYLTVGEKWEKKPTYLHEKNKTEANTVMRDPRHVTYDVHGAMAASGDRVPKVAVIASEPLSKALTQRWYPMLANQMLVVRKGVLKEGQARFSAQCFPMASDDPRRSKCPNQDDLGKSLDCFCLHDAKRVANSNRAAGNCTASSSFIGLGGRGTRITKARRQRRLHKFKQSGAI